MTASSGQSLAEEKPPVTGVPQEAKKQSASEILQWMADERLILESGRQAWTPGGYLGPSKTWG